VSLLASAAVLLGQVEELRPLVQVGPLLLERILPVSQWPVFVGIEHRRRQTVQAAKERRFVGPLEHLYHLGLARLERRYPALDVVVVHSPPLPAGHRAEAVPERFKRPTCSAARPAAFPVAEPALSLLLAHVLEVGELDAHRRWLVAHGFRLECIR